MLMDLPTKGEAMFISLAPTGLPILELRLQESLFAGLTKDADVSPHYLGPEEAEQLDKWAASCENPTGQKADLARSVAGLIRVVGPLGVTPIKPASTQEPRTFWDAVADTGKTW